jgi:hypothetical protein
MLKTRKWNYFHEKTKVKSRLLQTSSGECLGDEKYGLHNDKYTKNQSIGNFGLSCLNRS